MEYETDDSFWIYLSRTCCCCQWVVGGYRYCYLCCCLFFLEAWLGLAWLCCVFCDPSCAVDLAFFEGNDEETAVVLVKA